MWLSLHPQTSPCIHLCTSVCTIPNTIEIQSQIAIKWIKNKPSWLDSVHSETWAGKCRGVSFVWSSPQLEIFEAGSCLACSEVELSSIFHYRRHKQGNILLLSFWCWTCVLPVFVWALLHHWLLLLSSAASYRTWDIDYSLGSQYPFVFSVSPHCPYSCQIHRVHLEWVICVLMSD